MVATITRTTSLNSFWSISFCALVLCLHGYATFRGAQRYEGASARAWPGSASNKGGRPEEVTTLLALLVLSSLCLPFFILGSFLRVGNYANDGVKLGRDHALNPNLDACCSKVKNLALRRFWRNCVPLAQTSHLVAAFLLLLPDALLTAVEVQYGYRTTDSVWSSDVDFFYADQRAHVSDVMASINLTNRVMTNGSRVVVPTSPTPPGGWGSDHSLSLAFVNFVLALSSFSIRYAAVFWYTNKMLTFVFALQLLSLTLTAALGYSAFSCLYKVCHNQRLYINVQLSMSCHTSLALYLMGSTVMFLSTITIFEYIYHYFVEKLNIIEQKHRNTESSVQKVNDTNGGCQGYVTHTCAMVALVMIAACKGPVMYELVNLYRPTQDSFMLTGLVCEVVYMVLWIALWFALTVKQRWQFRILDYIPLGRRMSAIKQDQVVQNPTFKHFSASDYGGDNFEMQALLRPSRPRSQNRNSNSSFLDVVPKASRDATPEPFLDGRPDDSDTTNLLPKIQPQPGGANVIHKIQLGRRQGSRQTLSEDGVHCHSRHASDCSERGLIGTTGAGFPARYSGSSQHLNVRADVHDSAKTGRGRGDKSGLSHCRTGSGEVKLRKSKNVGEDLLATEYRNSIRNKCDDIYIPLDPIKISNNLNDPTLQTDGASPSSPAAPPLEPLPTLMSSFRDKVKESSRAASSYREQNRNLQLGAHGALERQSSDQPAPRDSIRSSRAFQPIQEGYENPRTQLEDSLGYQDGNLDSDARSSKCGSTISIYDDDHSSAFKRIKKSHSLPHKHRHSQLMATDSAEYQHNSLPPTIRKNGQSPTDSDLLEKPPRQQGRREHVSLRNASHACPQSTHLMARRDKGETSRRDSANYSLASSLDASSIDSVQAQGLPCQNGSATQPK